MVLEDIKAELVCFFNAYLSVKLPERKKGEHEVSTYFHQYTSFITIINPNEVKEFYQVIFNGYVLTISEPSLSLFIETLKEFNLDKVNKLVEIVNNKRDNAIRLLPFIPKEKINILIDENEDGPMGVNFIRIDKRFEGLHNFIFNEFQYIAKCLTKASSLFNADNTKIKTEELYLHFNTKEANEKTAFFMTLTKVPALLDINDNLEPSMVPITDEEFNYLFYYPSDNKEKASVGITIGDEIKESIQRINKQIYNFIHNIDTHHFRQCMDYTLNRVNGVLIPMIVTLHLEPFSVFGGGNKELLTSDESNPHFDACSELIDNAITALFTHLDTIPKPSHIDHYAIDYDGLGIYGRDENQHAIEAMVDPRYMFSTTFEIRYSESFMDVFKRYLKTIKNKYVFAQIGKIDEDSIKVPNSCDLKMAINNTDL